MTLIEIITNNDYINKYKTDNQDIDIVHYTMIKCFII